MTPEYVGVREHWTVREVLDYIREHGQDSETLNVVYVVDEQGLLIDDIRIRELLLTPLDKPVSDLMDRRFVALKATDDQATAVAAFRAYDRSALPVTDTAGMLIGIVTIDDVLDVAEADATKDIQRIGGSEALDEPYMDIGFGEHDPEACRLAHRAVPRRDAHRDGDGRIRDGDLAGRCPCAVRAAHHLERRQLGIAGVHARDPGAGARRGRAPRLVAGYPAGDSCRARARNHPRQHRISAHHAHGRRFSTSYGPHWLLLAITVGLSLIGVVLWGTMIGSLLPFILRRLGFDPATSSAPFVATLVDVTGLVIYFSVALVVLRGTLL